MTTKTLINQLFQKIGYTIQRVPKSGPSSTYDQDGLRTIHNHDFMKEASFCKAYERGRKAASELQWHWRVHIGLWAAAMASKLDGDFVECGVNRGFLSSAIMEFLDWDSLNKTFYLLDTFAGLDLKHASKEEIEDGAAVKNSKALESGFYVNGIESVRANFAQWKNVRMIEGSVPDTLGQVDAKSIAYLHLDMNCAPPEIAALHYFWDRLVPAGVVLLDDYAYQGYESQKHAMDAFAQQKQVMVASLPTGQGMIIKPPR